MVSVDVIARGLGAKGLQEADRANARLDALPKGLVYRGAVDYYKDLPNNADIGDVYTVKYTGTTGSNPDGSEYAWGVYGETNQWIKIGKDYESLPAVDGGTAESLVTTGEKYNWNAKQDQLENQVNIKSINGNSLLGSGNLAIRTYQAFSSTWTTNSTTEAFCAAVNGDSSAVEGMAYLGELRCNDLPGNLINGEAIIEVVSGSGTSGKVLHIELTSGDTTPYRWEYTYWNNGSNVSGWIGFQPELTAGSNIQINGSTISATDTTYSAATTSAAGLMPALESATVTTQSQTTKFLREDGTWAAPSYTQDTDLNTWRNIKVNGTEKLGTGVNTGALDLQQGTNISLTESNGTVTIAFNGTIPSVSLNGTISTNPTFYAATTAGTSGKFLKSSGSGAPSWDDASSVTFVDWS